MASDQQLKKWREELIRDYPNTDPYFIDVVLDTYKHDPDYIKKLPKKKFKEVKQEIPSEIKGAVEVITPDEEFIKKYFQEPIQLPQSEENENVVIEEIP
jgi:hypothetical protein